MGKHVLFSLCLVQVMMIVATIMDSLIIQISFDLCGILCFGLRRLCKILI